MTQIKTQQKPIQNNPSLGFARLEQSAIIGIIVTTLVAYIAALSIDLFAYVKGARTFADFPLWVQYVHIVVMLSAMLAVIIGIIVTIFGCVHLSNSGTMSRSNVLLYILLFIFLGWFLGLCICEIIFFMVEPLKNTIPSTVQPVLLSVGCLLLIGGLVCSSILIRKTRDKHTPIQYIPEMKRY